MVQLFYCIFQGSEVFEQFLDLLEVVGAREVVDFTGLADFDFDDVVVDGLRADRHADRVTDEVAVLELDAGALFAVVEQDVEAGLAALVIDALGVRQLLFLLGVDGDDDDQGIVWPRGQTMPWSSLFCSMAAAIVRPTPMP